MAEKEYIEREALLNEAKKRAQAFSVALIYEAIKEAPAADVVEVVRCKNCKHYEIHKPSVTLNCERNGRLIPMMPDDFCSYGERQVNNEN